MQIPATCPHHTTDPTFSSLPAPGVTAVGATQNAENDPEDHEVRTLQEWAANAIEQQGPYFKAMAVVVVVVVVVGSG